VRDIVMNFLNKWKCILPYEKAPELAEKLRELEPKLRPLRNLNIANADLLEVISVGSEKRRILDQIA
jgi:flagellar biosynthesis/type III secretory pathway chaperone